MKRPKHTLAALALCGLLAVVVCLLWPSQPEPEYNGKTLSQWLEIYQKAQSPIHDDGPDTQKTAEAVQAVHEMRASVIPIALKDIQLETPEWHSHLAEKMQDHDLDQWCPMVMWNWLNADRGEDGQVYFEMLGPDASNSVPDLVSILQHTASDQIKQRVIYALGNIGPAGFGPLMKILSNPKSTLHGDAMTAIAIAGDRGADARSALPLLLTNLMENDEDISYSAAVALGSLSLEPDIVVSALADRLLDTNKVECLGAVYALADFRDKARPAIPALKQALNTRNVFTRLAITNALNQIAPEILATNSPPP